MEYRNTSWYTVKQNIGSRIHPLPDICVIVLLTEMLKGIPVSLARAALHMQIHVKSRVAYNEMNKRMERHATNTGSRLRDTDVLTFSPTNPPKCYADQMRSDRIGSAADGEMW